MKNTRKVLGFAAIIAAIAFNAPAVYAVAIPTTGVTELTAGTWSNGSIPASNGQQWFKFTATAGTQYIHYLLGTLTSAKVQMYTADGNASGASTTMGSNTANTSRTVTAGTVYYINVTQFTGSGTYRIGVNTSATLPTITVPTTATQLTAGTWGNGNLTAAGGEQWFKFTSTGTSQYLHFDLGTVQGLYAQLFLGNGTPVGVRATVSGTTLSASRTGLTNNTEYYLMVYHYSAGTFKIGFNASSTAPAITMPSANVTQLAADEWKDGNIADAGGEQWFKFTATAGSQYIHLQPGAGTLNDIIVRVYVQAGTTVGNVSNLSTSGFISTERTVTSGTDYFIRVTPYSSGSKGTFKIGFNTTPVTPKVVATIPNATQLPDINKWADGSIASATGEQWFKFTSTGTTQYIHFQAGALANAYIQLYTSDGRLSEGRANLSAGTYSSYTSRTVSNNTVYYIRVTPSSSNSGAFKIGVTASTTAPTS